MNFVLVGEVGRAALSSVPAGAVIHAVGWHPVHGETNRAIVCHRVPERDVAKVVSADKVIGGDPAIWGLVKSPETPPEIVSEPEAAPKRKPGRPKKVKV